jgi:hypothetical protein
MTWLHNTDKKPYMCTLSLNPAVMLAATSLIFDTGTASISTAPTAVRASLRARAFSAALQQVSIFSPIFYYENLKIGNFLNVLI